MKPTPPETPATSLDTHPATQVVAVEAELPCTLVTTPVPAVFAKGDTAFDEESLVNSASGQRTAALPVPILVPWAEPQPTTANAEMPFPAVGTKFLGFNLIEELGRGAFGRVYLAEQGDLAARRVALKVARDMANESQTLAQLQHTNIVPIYSFHRVGTFQAVCMPYFGRVTLADVLRNVNSQPHLPSSGRQLRSTMHRHGDESTCLTGPRSAVKPEPDVPETARPVMPIPALATDGWGRLEELTYVEAILLLGSQLADGLAHAHARGVLHRDLKPANVLLTDDGRPMLLDFNLSDDTKARGGAERAKFGGTLPYMAPEHITAFALNHGGGVVDERSDVFSLGVMLYELLTGRHPYPTRTGKIGTVLTEMIQDRYVPVTPIRGLNPSVSPAGAAIVEKCMAVERTERYASADQVREDIERHLSHLPLRHAPNPCVRERARKWVRRHPRLASSTSVGVVAAAVVFACVGFAYRAWDRGRDDAAATLMAEHRTAFADAQLFLDDRNQSRPRLDAARERLGGLLTRYGVPADGTSDAWLAADAVRRLSAHDQEKVRADVGETFYQLAETSLVQALGTTDAAGRETHLQHAVAWNRAAGRYADGRLPRAVREQAVAIADLRGEPGAARQFQQEAAATQLHSPRDHYLTGAALARLGRNREALQHLQTATQTDPKNFSAWFVRGTVHNTLGQDDLAAAAFSACLAVRDDFAPAWMNRGLAYARLRFQDLAVEDYNRAIALDPKLTQAYLLRAAAKDVRGELAAAEEDLSLALGAETAPVRAYFLRADVRDRRGDKAGAAADRAAGLKLTPKDELSWIGRAEMRAATEPAGALADVEEALALNPFSLDAHQMKAHLLAERLNRPADAVDVLNRAVKFYPESAPARAGRGVLLARLGKRDAALQDARDALLADLHAPNLYQVGCIYALTSKANPADRDEAFRLVWAALRSGFGRDIFKTDPDLDPVRNDPAYARLVERVAELDRAERDGRTK
jgi:serine/threonine protein kinase/tetratricopeptide (TPR) repeat protein